jgi:glycosyltransferase involved in cell wall biosynthesis
VDPLLVICVPTYNRAGELSRLLANLDREIGGRDDVLVLVSDNASDDATPELLAAGDHRWLRSYRQSENIGPLRNVEWVVSNAPDCRYLWLFGDDDLIVEGSLATVVDVLAAESPAWLFLPHFFVDEQERFVGASPEPGVVERFDGPGAMYRAYHHWLTFLSASVVRADAMRDAVAEVQTDNAYGPLLRFFRAGLKGPCVVAPVHAVKGSSATTWADRAHLYQTLHFTALYEEGLHADLSAEDFGRTLDGLYCNGFGLDHWRRVEIERLVEAVSRFPHAESLRAFLWTIARERGLRDALPALDAAVAELRLEAPARELVYEGEAAFAQGDPAAAAERFAAAVNLMPTLAQAWNDLAVALHQLGRQGDAAAAVANALFVDPEDADALANLEALAA